MNFISNAVYGSCAIHDDYIDITDNRLINEVTKNNETSTTSTNQNPSLPISSKC